MKVLVLFAAVMAVAAAAPQSWMKLDKKMAMPMNMHMDMAPMAEARMAAPKAEARAQIEDMAFDMDEPGRYLYHYKTNNGIAVMERAAMDKEANKVQGAYEWTSPEGAVYKVEYVADEMGFHPQGAHLPVAPEIPEAIMRSLQWNAAHPEEDKEAMMMHEMKKMY